MKMAFATCVQLGLSCIEEIYNIGGSLDLLITLKDEKAKNKSGRIYLDDFSNKNSIPLLKISNINNLEVINVLREYEIDWLFIIGWSQIAKSELLHTPKLGCIGMHPTLLPIGRGRAAVPWAILKGLDETGVTMFKLDNGVDTGPIIGQVRIPLESDETATTLYSRVAEAHVRLISKYWNLIKKNKIEISIQDDKKATYWPGRKPEDGELFNDMTMIEADRLVRAITKPYPGVFYKERNKTIRIWAAKTSSQLNGKFKDLTIRLKDGYLIPIEYEFEVNEGEDSE